MTRLKFRWHCLTRRQVIKEVRSEHNALIQVVTVFDKPRLIVGGLLQSGGLTRKIWSKAVKKLKKKDKKISEVLILGLGCGDCAFEIRQYYPRAQMLGVEIDKHIVEAAKCYFNLASVKNLKIAVDDGAKYVERLSKQKKLRLFDLIIVDVYLGSKMPKPFRTKKFFKMLKKLLGQDGVVVYNHLFFKEHKKRAKGFIKKLETVFPEIKLQRTASNLLIFASP